MPKKVPLLMDDHDGNPMVIGEIEVDNLGAMIGSTIHAPAAFDRETFLCPSCTKAKCIGILVGNPDCVCCTDRHISVN